MYLLKQFINMDFIKKISDVLKNLIPSKKDQDNINVPPAPPTQNPVEEKPSEEPEQAPEEAPESEPIKQNFGAPEGEGKGL